MPQDKSRAQGRWAPLSLGALGVVYGQIGTSPLYALREAFQGAFGLPVTPENVLGVLSLFTWAIFLIVVVKYLTILLRADHQGQGGFLALLTLLTQGQLQGWRRGAFVALGLAGAALLYGDGLITPAMSVLSAVEGLAVVAPGLEDMVVPVTVAILLTLFAVQRRCTGSISIVFGPVILLWMFTIGILGAHGIASHPQVLAALNPLHGARLLASNGKLGFLALGAVVLAVTSGEALYADLGHFGRLPIRISWYAIVFPALLSNYFGQGALLLTDRAGVEQPFYELAPIWGRLPLVLLATAATVVASQALISAWYSLTQQLMNLGYVPRLSVRHTSSHEEGQIYVPKVNTALMFGCLALVVWFGSSSALAAAYGLSVTGTMAVTTILFYFVARTLWRWGRPQALTVCGVFLIAELALLGANLPKVFHGGWVPLAVGALLYLLMSTWRRGRLLLGAYFQRSALDIDLFLADIASRNPPRVHGTAIFFSKEPTGVPHVLLHHLKHCEVLHDRVVLLSILTDRVPEVPRGREVETIDLGQGFYRMTLRHGFRQSPNVTRALAAMTLGDLPVNLAKTSFYFGRETILATGRGAMAVWRKELFSVMARNAKPATAYFGIPPNRVVELGTQIAL